SKSHPDYPVRPLKSYVRLRPENVTIDLHDLLPDPIEASLLARAAQLLKKQLLPSWAARTWVETARKPIAERYLVALGQLSLLEWRTCRELPLLVSGIPSVLEQLFPKVIAGKQAYANDVTRVTAPLLSSLLNARRLTVLRRLLGQLNK